MKRFWTAVFIALAIIVTSQPSFAEKRIALVIGNGAYPNLGVLKNPPNDAKLMARTLRSLGFDVIERIDANQKGMKKAIKAFGNKLEAAGKDAVGLFYYAGHGVQVSGTNYMIPVNVDIQDEADVDIEAVSANAVQGNMAFAGNRLNIIIMDACRNNPFKRSFRSASRGLAKMDASKGTLIAYATSPGDVAADGKGKNSPYTKSLAKAMLTPGLTVERMFKEVRNQVVNATNSRQVPWEASSLTGADFYFKSSSATPPSPFATPVPVLPPSIDREALFWESIKDSPSSVDLEEFLKKFPNGTFSSLAKRRLDALKKPAQPAGPMIASIRRETEAKIREELRQSQEQEKLQRLNQAQRSFFDTLLADGDDAMRRYQKTAAVDKFNRALKLYPDNKKAGERLARAKKLVDPCMRIIGEWAHNFVVGTSDVTFSADGSMYSRFWLGDVGGRWECVDRERRKIVFRWNHGYVETVYLLPSGNEYKGKSDTNGIDIHGLRKGSPEAEAKRKGEEKKLESETQETP